MADAPEVKLHDEVRIGNRRAIVCSVYSRGKIEVVYLDDRARANNEGAVWRDDGWSFKHSGPVGGYADQNSHPQPFVSQLRRLRR